MNETGITRTPPEIIFVPPPDGSGMPRKRIVAIVNACIIGSVISIAFFIAGGVPVWLWIVSIGSVFLAVAIIVALRSWLVIRAHRALRRAFLEKHPADQTDPLVAALSRVWKEPDRVPKSADVRAALEECSSDTDNKTARVICFGQPDVPDVGELYFEPEIITPTGTVWRQLLWMVIAGALIALCLLDYLGVLPAWVPINRGFVWGFMYFFVAGAIALGIWVWKGMIRPTYIRMAPGIIQVLEYRYSKSKPTIRGYPMRPGTLAIFTRIRKHLVLTLSRGEHKDVLSFSRMRQSEQRIERAWQALLSTAPTPPLSDEELVG